MSGPSASGKRGLARLAALFSLRTISGKLIIGLALLFSVASVAVSVVTDHSLNRSLMASLNQQLQTATDTWYSCVQHSTGDPDRDAPRHAPGGYGMCSNVGQAPGTFELLLDGKSVGYKNTVKQQCLLSVPDQAVLVALPSDHGQPSSGQPSSGTAGPGPPDPPPATTYIRTLSSLGGEYLLTKVAGPEHGTTLVTGLSLATVQGTLANVENTQHVVYAAVLVLALALGTAMVQLSLRPLRRVAATATKVTELPLDSGEVMLPAGVPDSDPRTEVGRVGAAFNRMLFHVERALGRRAASEARLRRFAADASHELRTPLSAIRGYAELALRHPGPVPEDVTHALRRVESESARMSVLVDDLLLLARLDAGRPLEREPVDLSRLAIETTSDARVARGDHRWRLELPDEPVLVEGDEHRLHQVLANLLS
ncbi:MAG TPA: HAMP domain-containing sensor histidine kinase, partial [Streptosporangiaceae bacterium]|nr:HAMP domain-containing sensor histidine kinase [Streptosporangiaceae bacterium]